jgi:dihydroorotate dehydrogenase (NAD+) catalytic subunit
VVKGISLAPAPGNATPRLVEVPGGLLNAIGLQNPGFDGFVKGYMPFLREFDVPVIVNIWGRSLEEYTAVAARFDQVEGVAGLELNVSCPNIKEGGIAFGTNLDMLRRVVSAVRKKTRLPLMTKLTPNVPCIADFARAAAESGSDAISLINSIPAMVIDIHTRLPVLANKTGGLTGPAIHPVAVKLVWEAAAAVDIPIVGMGGIRNADDAIEFLLAGAAAVAVGTASFTRPSTVLEVIDGIQAYMNQYDMPDMAGLSGALRDR